MIFSISIEGNNEGENTKKLFKQGCKKQVLFCNQLQKKCILLRLDNYFLYRKEFLA